MATKTKEPKEKKLLLQLKVTEAQMTDIMSAFHRKCADMIKAGKKEPTKGDFFAETLAEGCRNQRLIFKS